MILNVFDGFKVISAQPFHLDHSIVALDIGVLPELSRLDVHQNNPGLFSPNLQCATDIFRAVVQHQPTIDSIDALVFHLNPFTLHKCRK